MTFLHLEAYSCEGLRSTRRITQRRREDCTHSRFHHVIYGCTAVLQCSDCKQVIGVQQIREPGKVEQPTLRRIGVVCDEQCTLVGDEVAKLQSISLWAWQPALYRFKPNMPTVQQWRDDMLLDVCLPLWELDGAMAPYFANSALVDNCDELLCIGDTPVVRDAMTKALRRNLKVQWLCCVDTDAEGEIWDLREPVAEDATAEERFAQGLPDSFLEKLTVPFGPHKGTSFACIQHNDHYNPESEKPTLLDLDWLLQKPWFRGMAALYVQEFLRRHQKQLIGLEADRDYDADAKEALEGTLGGSELHATEAERIRGEDLVDTARNSHWPKEPVFKQLGFSSDRQLDSALDAKTERMKAIDPLHYMTRLPKRKKRRATASV